MKEKQQAPANDRPAPVALPARREAQPIAEAIHSLVKDQPDAISFDTDDPANELLHLRCQVDPGIAAQMRDNWRGTVRAWYVGLWDAIDKDKGEILTLPSLCLLTDKDQLLRLTGWPAISSWGQIVKAAGAERIRAGLAIKVMRRQSGTAGRSYWIVLPDTSEAK